MGKSPGEITGLDAHRHPEPGPPGRTDTGRLRLALFLTLAFMGVEIVGGILSRSLSLMADAGHMLTDIAALGLSLFAAWLGGRPRTFEKTFGWRRFEIFAAFVNGAALWGLATIIGFEAFKRLRTPTLPASLPMMVVAASGLAVNIGVAAILRSGRDRSLNLKGAYLHVIADALGSVAVLVSAVIIARTGWAAADPIAAIVIAVLIALSSGRLVRESFQIMMESAPSHIDPEDVKALLLGIEGVESVHDLHVWTISSGWVSLSAHVAKRSEADSDALLAAAKTLLKERFGVEHLTLQIETAGGDCSTASCGEEIR